MAENACRDCINHKPHKSIVSWWGLNRRMADEFALCTDTPIKWGGSPYPPNQYAEIIRQFKPDCPNFMPKGDRKSGRENR